MSLTENLDDLIRQAQSEVAQQNDVALEKTEKAEQETTALEHHMRSMIRGVTGLQKNLDGKEKLPIHQDMIAAKNKANEPYLREADQLAELKNKFSQLRTLRATLTENSPSIAAIDAQLARAEDVLAEQQAKIDAAVIASDERKQEINTWAKPVDAVGFSVNEVAAQFPDVPKEDLEAIARDELRVMGKEEREEERQKMSAEFQQYLVDWKALATAAKQARTTYMGVLQKEMDAMDTGSAQLKKTLLMKKRKAAELLETFKEGTKIIATAKDSFEQMNESLKELRSVILALRGNGSEIEPGMKGRYPLLEALMVHPARGRQQELQQEITDKFPELNMEFFDLGYYDISDAQKSADRKQLDSLNSEYYNKSEEFKKLLGEYVDVKAAV